MKRKVMLLPLLVCLMLFLLVGSDSAVTLYLAPGGSEVPGVSLHAEKPVYTRDTISVKVQWVNKTSREYLFGAPYSLQKWTNGHWVYVGPESRVFLSIGYILRPHSSTEKTYALYSSTDAMEKGKYRIQSGFSYSMGPGKYIDYMGYTEFTIQ